MARIYSSDLSRELQEGAKLQVNSDRIPTDIADKVVPVMEVNPKITKYQNYTVSGGTLNNTGGTIITVPAGKRLIIYSAQIGWTKDAAANMTSFRLSGTIGGVSTIFLRIDGLNTTAETKTTNIQFPKGLIIDQNGTVQTASAGGVAAGNVIWSYSISGMLIDNDNS